MRLSHRARLVLTASSVAGMILALLFVSAIALYRRFEVAEEFDSLSPTARQALQAAVHGTVQTDLDAIADAEPAVSLAVLKDGRTIDRIGTVDVSGIAKTGRMRLDGTDITAISVSLGSYRVVAARPWLHREESANRFATMLTFLWFPLVGLIAGATWLASRATFKPLDDLRRQADAAREGGLHGRLRVAGQDEYGAFAASLNGFLDRLAAFIHNEEQFVADAAHELRTPLTALRGRIETTLLREREPSEYRAALGVVLAEAERLSALVEALLGSATSVSTRPVGPVAIDEVAEQAHARWIDRYDASGIMLELRTRPARAVITGSEIGAVLDNLLANALRVSPPNTTCHLEVNVKAEKVRLLVKDEGPGVPTELRERIFDRFVRGEEGRNRATGGFGIGLALCRRIVEARGGRIWVEPTDRGAQFEVELPAELPPVREERQRGRSV